MDNFQLPPIGFGPGSQPEPDNELAYMELPGDMRTYTARLPEIDDAEGLAPALALLTSLVEAADRVAKGGANETVDLRGLDPANRRLVAETIGEGEVAMKIRGLPALAVQESVFAGLWGVTGPGLDAIEVGRVPQAARSRAFEPILPARDLPKDASVFNAPSLLAELHDKSAGHNSADLHVVNLTLLPHTEGDLAWLETRLGQGATDILSRGYGNCRCRATALPHVWRVQFFNSMDSLILDTFEVTDMPEVAQAGLEDLMDSAERLRDVLEAIR
ncbi:hydrogenase expression/formation protein [Jannaschia seohaensis]|uniref:Hydrogenase-1 operon protein HyaF n=1 Tax=Jannaschia seohaensis TaxID=475081 RepID=A0A2Y9A1H4_9RHOB|nr:hydrogenase expression/formation protein [Jannaschia seohaensis]PWJ21847.1 hydrogenase-1 operon protein HyaF [Jannaschia seohaensis]SSA38125.1 hydrogenase-1 operon protein HyaF [Jannaschia seohaensis]